MWLNSDVRDVVYMVLYLIWGILWVVMGVMCVYGGRGGGQMVGRTE